MRRELKQLYAILRGMGMYSSMVFVLIGMIAFALLVLSSLLWMVGFLWVVLPVRE